jgi:PhnB protein
MQALSEGALMAVNPIPDGYPTVCPYLYLEGAADAIEFYKDIFGATERMRMPGMNPGDVGHAELEFGNSIVMMADEWQDGGAVSPKKIGGSPVCLAIYVDDVDKVIERAVAAGATIKIPIEDKFYGDRSGQVVDPWGHIWSVQTHVEDVSPEEMQRRLSEMTG